jgi:hypothetical protein
MRRVQLYLVAELLFFLKKNCDGYLIPVQNLMGMGTGTDTNFYSWV